MGESLALTHVQVVDVATGALRASQTLLVSRGRIRAVGADGSIAIPRGTRVVDGRGMFAVPGLWDMHVHTSATAMRPRASGEEATLKHNAEFVFPLFVANGVTGIRDMSGNLAMLLEWRRAITSGAMIGPRMIVTGGKVGGARAVVPSAPFPITTAADVRASVLALKRDGADFVKYLELPSDLFPVLMASAKEAGLPVAAHVPPWMPVEVMSDAGASSTEHLLGVFQSSAAIEDALLDEARNEQTWWGRLLVRARVWDPEQRQFDRQRRALASYDESRARALLVRLAKNGTWQTPTLTAIRHVNGILDDSLTRQARAPFVLPFMVGRRKDWVEGDTLASLAYARRAFQMTAAMSRAGVPILAGSDMPGTNRLPGFSLLDELEHLVEAGLTPLEALRAATIRPAEFLHARDSLGTLEAGKAADIILVRANPLENINGLRELESVVLGGRYLSRRDLDAMLDQVREVARQWRLPPVAHKETR